MERSLGFVGFILVHWVHLGAPLGSLGSFRRAIRFVGFIKFRWGHTGAPIGSSGSFGFIGFIRSRPGCGWVLWGPCVHSASPWGLLSSFAFVEFILERSSGGRFNSGS